MLYDTWKGGYHKVGCNALNREAFIAIHLKPGGCCAKNCAFYKERPEDIRTSWGTVRK
jgi:hypothetical protein